MNSMTGQVFADLQTARRAASDPADVVELRGDPAAVARISAAVVARRRAANRRARVSRKRNRHP